MRAAALGNHDSPVNARPDQRPQPWVSWTPHRSLGWESFDGRGREPGDRITRNVRIGSAAVNPGSVLRNRVLPACGILYRAGPAGWHVEISTFVVTQRRVEVPLVLKQHMIRSATAYSAPDEVTPVAGGRPRSNHSGATAPAESGAIPAAATEGAVAESQQRPSADGSSGTKPGAAK